MTPRLALFDFDGTLADSYPLFADALNELAARHGFRHTDADTQQRLRGLSATEVLRELALPLWKVPAVLGDARKLMRERIDEVAPFAGIVETLHALIDRGVAVAVATSNSPENVRAVLGDSLIARFAAIECSSSLFGKSHRLRGILRKTGIPAEQAIYVGDEIRDAQAARGVGLAYGAVAWGYTQLEALLGTRPQAVFRVPADLLSLAGPIEGAGHG
ncbi:HAD hydrolase-like protein [Burkholderia gladioli]|uniref:HAD hydrolase-like protein n=1 Tax=Burkholderia gladioli TaxID=28095 RepID=UPI000CFED96A|nr:HAD hydrolase-like protein [Burkholderia gladioli]MBU9213901.1 HAD hydrolase-like protein [Burkholderia gladioli]MBU9320441.1 HAD hydrolase-like protein [Burkholderia gladioli]MDN7723891.1 HAD hydrolase-like protein [Burkholderia gladioli]PRE81647.1 haloacid dehalogenase [Burkholderia gladioli]